ncbi:DUF2541 family protein [Citrobacter freundii]
MKSVLTLSASLLMGLLLSSAAHANEWKGLPLIMRLINSCAIMG